MGFESSGFEEASGYVVGQVLKSQGDPAEVFEASVDRLCRCLGYADVGTVVPCQARFLGWVVGIVAV